MTSNEAIEQQRQIVRLAYAETNSLNDNYNREFDKLAVMNRLLMANEYREAKCLPETAKTPYCEATNER